MSFPKVSEWFMGEVKRIEKGASSHLRQFSAVRQLTPSLQQRKPRHPNSPQVHLGEAGSPTNRIIYTAA